MDTWHIWTAANRSEGFFVFGMVKRVKNGPARLSRLLDHHADLMPREGWTGVTHKSVRLEDDAAARKLENELRRKLAASCGSRLWRRVPGAPGNIYRGYTSDVTALQREISLHETFVRSDGSMPNIRSAAA